MKQGTIFWNSMFLVLALIIILFAFITFSSIASATWWNSSWNYKERINLYSISGANLTNYPYQLSINTSALVTAGKLQSDCDDLRFTNSTENLGLSYELVSGCNTTTTQVWVKVPLLNTDNSTYIYMYYGNSGASKGSDNATMWSDYVLVLHMSENATNNNSIDSSPSGYNYQGTTNTNVLSAAGKFGNGFNFADAYYLKGIAMPNFRLCMKNNCTVTLWLKSNVADWSSSGPQGFWRYYEDASNLIDSYYRSGQNDIVWQWGSGGAFPVLISTSSPPIDSTAWSMISSSWSVSGNQARYWLNESNKENDTGTLAWTGTSLTMNGIGYGAGLISNMIFDEFRIANFTESDDWVKMDYAQGTQTLFTFGTEIPRIVSPALKNVQLNLSWADTYVLSSSGGTNYGTLPYMMTDSATQYSFILINLSDYKYGSSIVNATYNWYLRAGTASGTANFKWCNDNFNETNLTWNNKNTEVVQCDEEITMTDTIGAAWNNDIYSDAFLSDLILDADGISTLNVSATAAKNWSTKEWNYIPWLNLTYYDTFAAQPYHNSQVMENTMQRYNLTVKITELVLNVTALFNYNGTYYPVSYVSSAEWFNFTSYMRVPALTENYNATRNLNWSINVSYIDTTYTIYNLTSSQTVYRGVVNNTNAPGNGVASRFFQCRDEISNILVTCNISTTWKVWTPENYGNAYYRSYLYTNNSANFSQFWHYPPVTVSNLTVSYNVSALGSAGTYPQRNFAFTNEPLNATNTTKILYLLSSTDGIYVTFQVLNAQSNNPISGATVIINRASDGLLIGGATTGPTGTVTFWMNPNIAYIVTFSHPSYPTVIYTDTFTGPTYTVYMGGGGQQNQTNNFTGIYWQVTPATNAVLTTNQKYNFSLFLTSYYSNISLWGYYLSNGSNIMLAQNWTTVNSTNITTMNFNVSGNTTIQMNIYWITDTGIGNATVKWGAGNYYQGNYSIKTFFDDLRLYNSSGTPLFNPFTMSLIAFAIIFLITGALCWVSGIYSPLAIGTMITSLTWFFTWVGMIGSPTARTKYAIPIMLTVLFGAYYIWEQTK